MTSDLLSLVIISSLYACLVMGRHVQINMEEMETNETTNCTLKCTAHFKPGVSYSAISWYKIMRDQSHSRKGLLRSDMNGTTLRYVDSYREMLLDDSFNLFLPDVTCQDGGVYKCRLSAPVGEQNQEGQVLLTITGCPEESTHFLQTQEETREDLTLPHDVSDDNLRRDTSLVLFACAFLVTALIVCVIIYKCTKNTFKENNEKLPTVKKEILLDAPLKPLDKKDLKLIYTLGPKRPSVKQVLV